MFAGFGHFFWSKRVKVLNVKNNFPAIENFRLLDQFGRPHELYRLSSAKAIVIFSHGLGCPIVQKNLPSYRALEQKYSSEGVEFFMLNANLQDKINEIRKWSVEHKIDRPILIDSSQMIAKSLNIDRTASVTIIDPATWRIVYNGAVDDKFFYESKKSRADNPYADWAIQKLLDNDLNDILSSPARGCAIMFEEKNPTYVTDIAPILKSKCLVCHIGTRKFDNLADFSGGYDKFFGWAKMIREVTRMQRMPPGSLDPEFCDKFSDSICLTPKESRLITQWVDSGAPRGSGMDPLINYVRQQKKQDRPEMIFDLPEQIIPAESKKSIYRIVSLGAPTTKDLYLRGFSVKPGNLSAIHHLSIVISKKPFFAPNGQFVGFPKNKKGEYAFFDQDADPQFFEFSLGDRFYPKGTARYIPKGSYMIAQYHFEATGQEERDKTQVGFYLYKERTPPKKIKLKRLIKKDFTVPPNTKEYIVEENWVVPEDIKVYQLGRHMHYRGTWMKIIATIPGKIEPEVLYSAPFVVLHWKGKKINDFNLKVPIFLPKGTKITLQGAFDNTKQNPGASDAHESAHAGLSIYDEMFKGNFLYTAE